MHGYTGVATKTVKLALEAFCRWVIRTYGPDHLGTLGEAEIKKEMAVGAATRFPRMMGSID